MRRLAGTALFVALTAGAATTTFALGAGLREARQKDRRFEPRALEVQAGDVVRIVNDDGELLHHAYVKSDSFSFDSGEQEPGSATDIRFTVPGSFVVLCGIHPKMHMSVVVR